MSLIIKLSDLANSHEETFELLSHETCSVADFHGSPESIGFVFSHAFSQGIRDCVVSAKNMAIDDDLLANCPRRNC